MKPVRDNHQQPGRRQTPDSWGHAHAYHQPQSPHALSQLLRDRYDCDQFPEPAQCHSAPYKEPEQPSPRQDRGHFQAQPEALESRPIRKTASRTREWSMLAEGFLLLLQHQNARKKLQLHKLLFAQDVVLAPVRSCAQH